MTRYIDNAELRGYHSGNTSDLKSDADYIITDDLITTDLSVRAGNYKGQGKIDINNNAGEYSQTIQPGDRIEFQTTAQGVDSGYGTGGYGVGPYGGGTTREWTGMVQPFEIQGQGVDNYDLSVNAEQFASSVMDIRTVHGTFEDQQIVGSNGIINEILAEECPELSTDRLPSKSASTSIYLRGKTVLDAVASLAVRANMLLCCDGVYVDLVEPSSISPQFTATRGDDVGSFKTKVNPDNMVNELRVEGGTGHDIESESSQSTVDGYQTITSSNRITYQIQTRKSELERIEIYTRTTGSGEDYIARLQKDENGAPIAPGDSKSDIVKKKLDPTFVDNDGWTGFILPQHTLPEPFPWLIIESGGSQGQEVGINTATGNPGVIPHFPYQVILNRVSQTSIDKYRRREDKVSDDSIGTFEAARDLASEVLAKRDQPEIQVQVPVYTDRMHSLSIGDVISFNHSEARAVGDFAVTEVRDMYETGQVNRDMTLQKLDA